ncbi:MAG: glycosyltransferase family 39 protein, partial [Planctomycetota bacterium]|nr:glycosyltransferase family 39 protein [Planctomycetota bacterium]
MLPRSERWVLALLVGLTLVTGLMRTRNLDALLPHQHEPDPYCVLQAEFLEALDAGETQSVEEWFGPNRVRMFYYYPLHIARLWRLQARPLPLAEPLTPERLDQHLTAAGEPFLRGRRWSAWLSALILPGVFLLARRFLDPWPALLAAALAGTSLQHLIASGQAKPHAIAAAGVAWALWGATVLRRHRTGVGLVGGGACFALGVCALHSGVALAGAALVAFFLRERREGWKDLARWVAPVLIL